MCIRCVRMRHYMYAGPELDAVDCGMGGGNCGIGEEINVSFAAKMIVKNNIVCIILP